MDEDIRIKIAQLQGQITEGFAQASEERQEIARALRANHGEQMRKFQDVIDAAESIGMQTARDLRLAALEKSEQDRDQAVATMRTELDRLRQLVENLTGAGAKS